MKTWHLGVSRDGWTLSVRDEPWWAQLAETLWDLGCRLTCGWLGGHGMPEWMWNIPVGWPKREDDGWLANSLPGRLCDLENWALCWTDRHGRELAVISISDEAAKRIDPKFHADHERWMSDPQ